METRKIALACFIGGAICCAVALMFSPDHWWLGLIAGFAGGYLGYEFREVVNIVSEVWREICIEIKKESNPGELTRIKEYLISPHPFFYLAMIPASLPVFWILSIDNFEEAEIMGTFICAILILFIFTYITTALTHLIAFIGAKKEKSMWPESELFNELVSSYDRRKYYCEKPPTYRNVTRWIFKGICVIIWFLTWPLLKYAFIGTWMVIRFSFRFAWRLFKLIHSEKRVLCAIDGTFGGTVAYLWLAPTTASFPAQITLVFFGGLLGAAFGILNWEIVSKRILKLAPMDAE